MTRPAVFLLVCLLAAMAVSADEGAAPSAETQVMPMPETSSEGFTPYRKEARRVAHKLICYCGCDRMTLDDCVCGVAMKEIRHIEQLLSEGKSEDEIIALYVAEHGESVKATPDKGGFNLTVWILPFFGVLLGLGLLALALRRMTARRAPDSSADDSEPAGTAPELSEEQRLSAEEALRRYKF